MKTHPIPVHTGMRWLQLGWQTFWRQPLALGWLSLLLLAGHLLTAFVPLVGQVLITAMQPWLALTLLAAASQAAAGQRATPALLLTWRCSPEQQRGMWELSALYVLIWLGLLKLTALAGGGPLAPISLGLGPGMPELWINPPTRPALANLMKLLLLLLTISCWHASGLVYWHGISPIKALFLGVAATLRNWRAFMLFSLGGIAMFTVPALALVLGTGLLSVYNVSAAGTLEILASAVILAGIPGFTICAGICSAAMLFSFRDCFSIPAAPPGGDASVELNSV